MEILGSLDFKILFQCLPLVFSHVNHPEPFKVDVLFPFYRWRDELKPREGQSLSEKSHNC